MQRRLRESVADLRREGTTAGLHEREAVAGRHDPASRWQRQITYNGRPLYYYVGDKSPGQILCQNVNEFGGTWLVVDPNGLLVR